MSVLKTICVGFCALLLCSCGEDPQTSSGVASTTQDQFFSYSEYLTYISEMPQEDGDTTKNFLYLGDQPLYGQEAVDNYYDTLKKAWNAQQEGAALTNTSTQALAIFTDNGQDLTIPRDQWENINYCIDYYRNELTYDEFKALLPTVENAFENALSQWEVASNHALSFTYRPDLNGNSQAIEVSQSSGKSKCSRNGTNPNNIYLMIRLGKDTNTYSHGEASRNVINLYNLVPSLPQYIVSLALHESGHVLGFAHEFAIPNGTTKSLWCRDNQPESGYIKKADEVTSIRVLSPYDPKSIMNYPDCSNISTPITTLSANDILGVQKVYNNASSSTWKLSARNFESGYNYGTPYSGSFITKSGDFNGDGISDFVRISNTMIFTYYGKGDGTFTHTSPSSVPQGTYFSSAPTTHATVYPVYVGDFNGDGMDDIIRYHNIQGIWVFTSTGTDFKLTTYYNQKTDFRDYSPVVGDFYVGFPTYSSDDESDDFILVGKTSIKTLLGHYDATNANTSIPQTISKNLQILYPEGADYGPATERETFIANFNTNDNLSNAGGLVMLLADKMIVHTSFAETPPIYTSYSAINGGESWNFGAPAAVTTVSGDFNGDGRTDFCRLGSRAYYPIMGKTTSPFFSAKKYIYPDAYTFGWTDYDSKVGDFNGDGYDDIIRLGPTDACIMISKGDGTFTMKKQVYPTGYNFGTKANNYFETVVGQFNQNGKTDIIRMNGTQMYTMLF